MILFIFLQIDTLQPILLPPYHIYIGDARNSYKATKFTPQSACYIKEIMVALQA